MSNSLKVKRGRVLPPLPAWVSSQLGPIPVEMVDKKRKKNKDTTLGRYHMPDRRIEIDTKSAPIVQWQTLFHEWAHMVLCDAGLHNAFTPEQQEVICDAIGTARAVELLAE